MLFTQPLFLFLLLPFACAVFYAVTPKFGASFGFAALLVISLVFYLPWGLFYFALLIASITVNFLAAYWLLMTPDSQVQQRRTALTLGLAYDFGTLIWFKYRVPLLQGLGLITNSRDNFSLVDVAIPIGISFYTFQ